MIKLIFAVTISAILLAPLATLEAQASACVSATDSYAQIYRDGYGSMVSRTDAGSVTQRTNLSLPTLQASQVVVVSDSTTCRNASAAFDSAVGVSAADEAPIVLQLGTQWVVIKRLKYERVRLNVLFNQDFTAAQKKIWF